MLRLRQRVSFQNTHQFYNTAMLPNDSPRFSELGHISDGLSSQGLEGFDWVQELHDALEASHVDDGSEDFPIVTNPDQDF